MTEERYKQLMAQVGMPNSVSLLQVLQQAVMETEMACGKGWSVHSVHVNCHDTVCNGSRAHPRGTKGVSCSCKDESVSRMKIMDMRAMLLEAKAEIIDSAGDEGIVERITHCLERNK